MVNKGNKWGFPENGIIIVTVVNNGNLMVYDGNIVVDHGND